MLEELQAGALPPVVIPPSRLKEIRRDFYGRLRNELTEERSARRGQNRQQALASLLPPTAPQPGRRQLTVAIRDLRDAGLLDNRQVDRVLVPLTPATAGRADRLPAKHLRQSERLVWDLPFIIFDRDWQAHREAVAALYERGWRSFRLNNLSHFRLFAELPEAKLICGYRLFSLNSQALLAWRQLGAGECTLYIEDDRDNLAALLQRDAGIERALTVYGQVPLMTTRVPMPKVRPDAPLVSDRDEAYHIHQQGEITTLHSETDFSILGHLRDLEARGVSNFVIEAGHLGPFSDKGRHLLEAFATDRPLPATSPFNYLAEME